MLADSDLNLLIQFQAGRETRGEELAALNGLIVERGPAAISSGLPREAPKIGAMNLLSTLQDKNRAVCRVKKSFSLFPATHFPLENTE